MSSWIVMIGVFFGCAVLGAFGCAGPSKTVRTQNIDTQSVFPYGVYQHDIRLQLQQRGAQKAKTYSFKGVVQLEPENIHVVALGPMGITVFEINDNLRTGQTHVEIFVDRVKPHEARLREYYKAIKSLFTLKRGVWIKEGSVVPSPNGTRFIFGRHDKNRIPEIIYIKAPDFAVDVKVTAYEI